MANDIRGMVLFEGCKQVLDQVDRLVLAAEEPRSAESSLPR